MIPIAKPTLGEEEVKAAGEVILSGWVAQGPKVKEFETAFAQYVESSYACAVTSCTTALHLALLTLGIKQGDVVVTVSHSFIASTNCIRYCGADPAFLDIDPNTYNMDPNLLGEFLGKKCRNQNGQLYYKEGKVAAILVVHQMGMPCDLKAILQIAQKYDLPVVEDAACAVGSEITFDSGKNWEKIGKPHGDIACFSFHPRKLLTTGEGGMLTTNSAKYDKRMRLLRHQCMSISDLKRHQSKSIIIEKYEDIGYNYRLTDIQAAVGIEQLKKVSSAIKKRRELAQIYKKELSRVSWLKVPHEPDYCRTNWQSFPVRLKKDAPMNRDNLMQYLLDNGVSTRPGIMNVHRENPYKTEDSSLTNSEYARETVLLLPLYFEMTADEINTVIRLIENAR